jgi:hypothetical protein
MARHHYSLALQVLAIACASTPISRPALSPVPAELRQAVDSALASLDSATVPKYYSGQSCPMPVQRGDNSGDSSMVIRYRRGPRDTTSTHKQLPSCYNPLFR